MDATTAVVPLLSTNKYETDNPHHSNALWTTSQLGVQLGNRLKANLLTDCSTSDFVAIDIIEQRRPESLRAFDQIPMRPLDLLLQAKLMAPHLGGKSVAFVGDHDGASLVLGLLAKLDRAARPARMLLLDFDKRVLEVADRLAAQYGFDALLDTRLYNVFDSVPPELIGQFDWFYTNPPYGCRNQGESARLFITRGCELARRDSGRGCIIIPDDEQRSWTSEAMLATQEFLSGHGWIIDEKVNQFHQYRLDDDRDLASSIVIARRVSEVAASREPMQYASRQVSTEEIPHFYGQSVRLPYPRYIQLDGSCEEW